MVKKAMNSGFEDKINKLRLLHYISVEMNRPNTTQALLELILERCLELTGAKTGSIMLIDENDNVLDIVAYKNLPAKAAQSTRLKVGDGITGWVAQSGNPKLVNNTRQDPKYIKVRDDLLSELAVPINTDNKIIGVISVDSNKENAFTEGDLELLTMVAELAAQIIVKDEMKDKLELKIRMQEVLIEAFNIIERENEINSVFNSLMSLLAERMGVSRGMLVLFDKDDPSSLTIKAGYKISSDSMKKGIYKIGEGVIGNAVLQGKTIGIEDVSSDEMFLNKLKIKRTGMGQVSFIASPIKTGKAVIGVLAVEKVFKKGEVFSDIVDTLTILTSMIAYRVRSYQRQHEETQKLISENIELRKELKSEYSFKNIVGRTDAIRKVMEQVKTVAGTPAPVLITGETGTGKELIAKILHLLSDRRDKKFISVNCAAIPENLLESELFGYEKGAFTGAASSKKGKFELAHSGTLFLDEIGELPLHLQSKLLRSIQQKEIEPLGSEKSVSVDIRIITATNKDLKKEVDLSKFRPDLFFRLNVININLPPLRERKDDVMLLTEHFIKKFNDSYNKKVAGISDEVRGLFLNHTWPGNIRELENVIERAVIMSKSNIIDAGLIPDIMETGKKQDESVFGIKNYVEKQVSASPDGSIFANVVGKIEKIVIEEALLRTNYNKSQAAKILGINRNTLKAKIREFGIS